MTAFYVIGQYLKNPNIIFNNEMAVESGESVMEQLNIFFSRWRNSFTQICVCRVQGLV